MNYEIYCGPRRCVRPLAPGEMPPLGAHLIRPWLGYTHHGIYVGDGKVVHYGALMYNLIRKPVEEVTLATFAEGRPVYRRARIAKRASTLRRSFAARVRGSERNATACSATTASTSSNGACTTNIAASRWKRRWNFRAGSASGSWWRCCDSRRRNGVRRSRAGARSQHRRGVDVMIWPRLRRGVRRSGGARARRRMSSNRCWVVVGHQLRRSVRPMGRTTSPAGWGSATSNPACIS